MPANGRNRGLKLSDLPDHVLTCIQQVGHQEGTQNEIGKIGIARRHIFERFGYGRLCEFGKRGRRRGR